MPERRSQERRDAVERRHAADRRAASAATDVTRAEHENLYSQVQHNAEDILRLEADLRKIREVIEALRFRTAS